MKETDVPKNSNKSKKDVSGYIIFISILYAIALFVFGGMFLVFFGAIFTEGDPAAISTYKNHIIAVGCIFGLVFLSFLIQFILILLKKKMGYLIALVHVVLFWTLSFIINMLIFSDTSSFGQAPMIAGVVVFFTLAWSIFSIPLILLFMAAFSAKLLGVIVSFAILLILEIWKLNKIKKYCVK